ncbi:MYND finger domain containing protein [Balamuthia mandrillaris]
MEGSSSSGASPSGKASSAASASSSSGGGGGKVAEHRLVNQSAPAVTTDASNHFHADPLAERSLSAVTDVFPANWKTLSDKTLTTKMRRLVALVEDSNQDLLKRQHAMLALDNLAWHSRTKTRILHNSVGALTLLCSLSFGQAAELDKGFQPMALNALNKIALCNKSELFRRGVFKQALTLGETLLRDLASGAAPQGEAERNNEYTEKLLLGVANIILTFANDTSYRSFLTLGGNALALAEGGTSALELILTFLTETWREQKLNHSFSLSLKGSSCMALMKICEACANQSEDCWKVLRDRVTKSNVVKNLIMLLMRKASEGSGEKAGEREGSTKKEEQGFDEALLATKTLVLDLLYALSHSDSFENVVKEGKMGSIIIRSGGCIVCCKLIQDIASRLANTSEDAPLTRSMKTQVEVVRAGVSLLSSMAFVEDNRSAIVAALGLDALVSGVRDCRGDAHTISYGCRALYLLDAELQRQAKKAGEEQGSHHHGANEASSQSNEQETPEEQKAKLLLERQCQELLPQLLKAMTASKPSTIRYPSNEAYMLRHICLLLFLFTSVPSLLSKIMDEHPSFLDILCTLLDGTVREIQVNALAVIANFVETEQGAAAVCHTPKLLQILVDFDSGKIRMGEHLKENVSWAIQGLLQKAPHELDKLGVVFQEKLKVSSGSSCCGHDGHHCH